jgi:outer membrane protein
MKTSLKFIAVAAAVVCGQTVWAQSAGEWLGRAGFAVITPKTVSQPLSAPSLPDSRTDVGNAGAPAGGITYMLTDSLSVDVPISMPFQHTLYGDGALKSLGKLGDIKALPVTVFLQYRLMDANSKVRPYIGLGATYAYFFDARGTAALTGLTNPGGPATKITVDSKTIFTPQVGVTVALDKKWFLDAFYSKSTLSTTTTLSTGQKGDVALDPASYGFSVGFKF